MPNSVEKDIKNARKAKAIEIRAAQFFCNVRSGHHILCRRSKLCLKSYGSGWEFRSSPPYSPVKWSFKPCSRSDWSPAQRLEYLHDVLSLQNLLSFYYVSYYMNYMNKYIKNHWTPITARLKFSRGAKNVTFWDGEEGMSKRGFENSLDFYYLIPTWRISPQFLRK